MLFLFQGDVCRPHGVSNRTANGRLVAKKKLDGNPCRMGIMIPIFFFFLGASSRSTGRCTLVLGAPPAEEGYFQFLCREWVEEERGSVERGS